MAGVTPEITLQFHNDLSSHCSYQITGILDMGEIHCIMWEWKSCTSAGDHNHIMTFRMHQIRWILVYIILLAAISFSIVWSGARAALATTSLIDTGCGLAEQEGENGNRFGAFVIGVDGAASGGGYVHVPKGAANSYYVPDERH
ncbi:MAG: hypothetical protein GXP42_04450, partial [Chloroflexi bacterium]|nr:hypothetical protein [Chloroflexota bacterium]